MKNLKISKHYKKPTCNRLKQLIKEEKESTDEYVKYGFMDLARDENLHRIHLNKLLKKMKCINKKRVK